LDLFGTDRLDEQGQPVGIAAQFFAMAPTGQGLIKRVVVFPKHLLRFSPRFIGEMIQFDGIFSFWIG